MVTCPEFHVSNICRQLIRLIMVRSWGCTQISWHLPYGWGKSQKSQKPQLGDRLMKAVWIVIASNGVHYLQIVLVGSHNKSGRKKEGKDGELKNWQNLAWGPKNCDREDGMEHTPMLQIGVKGKYEWNKNELDHDMCLFWKQLTDRLVRKYFQNFLSLYFERVLRFIWHIRVINSMAY